MCADVSRSEIRKRSRLHESAVSLEKDKLPMVRNVRPTHVKMRGERRLTLLAGRGAMLH